jgi:hypothetical protein
MSHIVVEQHGAVGILTIARRARMNSLDVATARDLRKAGLALARDRSVRAVIVRGDGGVFCSGADLKYIRAGGEPDDLGYLRAGGAPPPSGGYGALFKGDPRVPARHDLGDPARAQAVHRRGRRSAGGRRSRPGDGVRSGRGLGARDLRVGLRQDRPDRRRVVDVLPAAAPRPAPGARVRPPSGGA